MLIQFWIADILLYFKCAPKRIVIVISILYAILYLLLLNYFYSRFHSVLIVISILALLLFFYFIKINYLKRYLRVK